MWSAGALYILHDDVDQISIAFRYIQLRRVMPSILGHCPGSQSLRHSMFELLEVDPPNVVHFVNSKNTGRFRFTRILSGDTCVRSAERMRAWNLSMGLHNA